MQDIASICVGGEDEEFSIDFGGQTWKFKKRELTWSKINSILSEVMEIDPSNNGKVKFNVEKYNELTLKALLTETPWNLADTGVVLKQIKPEFGQLLEEHIPHPSSMFGSEEEQDFFESRSTGSSKAKSSTRKTRKQ